MNERVIVLGDVRMATALILEDDVLLAMAMSLLLQDGGYTPYVAHNVEAALDITHRTTPELLIADWSVNGQGSSLYVAEAVRAKNARARVVFVSGYPEDEIRSLAAAAAPYAVYQKPLNFDLFCSEVLTEGSSAEYNADRAPSIAG